MKVWKFLEWEYQVGEKYSHCRAFYVRTLLIDKDGQYHLVRPLLMLKHNKFKIKYGIEKIIN